MRVLDQIGSTEDLKHLSEEELQTLCKELREFLIEHVSKTGGHVSSNLGVVELTVALHRAFSSPRDKIIWDVGHQAYIHKILTGRKEQFTTLRQAQGLSGFPKASESEHDSFDTGHASTSISAALGMAKARDLQKEDYEVIAVIGDGSLTGGMAYEAMNQAGKSDSHMIVVLNDNEMAISKNVGGLSYNLSKIRTRKMYLKTKVDTKKVLLHLPFLGRRIYQRISKLKKRFKYFLLNGPFFEELGFKYIGPIDGHDLKELEKAFQAAKALDDPVLIHVKTVKGKGYKPAEKDPAKFHGIGKFDSKTGATTRAGKDWSAVFGENLVAMAKQDRKITAITAAMPVGTGLSEFERLFPERFFDVGIAEEHAVTFAAGLAKAGMKPVAAIYSTFLQRAYDQIVHDVCLPDLPVVLAVDRSGIVGADGSTHQGIFDLAFLTHIPGLTVLAPADSRELGSMMCFALSLGHPCAIRYPRGAVQKPIPGTDLPVVMGKMQLLKQGSRIAVLALGDCTAYAMEAASILEKEGISITVVNARFAAPIDSQGIRELLQDHKVILTVEDHVRSGGFGEKVLGSLDEGRDRVHIISIGDQFVPQGDRDTLLASYGISPEGIAARVRTLLQKGN